jgi:hypothetical protein
MSTIVRTTHLEVWITPPPSEDDPTPTAVLDPAAYAATCSFGFDQRYAEATVHRTGGSSTPITYWSEVQIKMSCFPGAGAPEDGLETRFRGYVVPVENALFPIENVLTCKGHLYRAAWVRNQTPGGTDLAPAGSGGVSDQDQVKAVLTACGVAFIDANISGTGKALGSRWIDLANVLPPGPFTWAEGQSGLDYLEALDEASVPDTYPGVGPLGRYRTIESLGGYVYRFLQATKPSTFPDYTFSEGVDVLGDARISRDVTGAANRVTVTGAPMPTTVTLVGTGTDVGFSTNARFTVSSEFAPYLPGGLPNGPEGYPTVTTTFSSPLLEKSTIAEEGDVLACQAVADFLLGEYNCALDTLEFSTPRDDLLGPGQTIHLDSPRLGLVDPARHYWLQHLDVTLDERGAFTQRLVCLRRS